MMMLWYKVWRESRVRFELGMAVVATLCLAYVFLAGRLMPGLMHQRPPIRTYDQYVYWEIFSGPVLGLTQILFLLLGLGGLQRDRKQGTLGFTLALPVGRSGIVASRALIGLLQVVAIAMVPIVVLSAASPLAGERFAPQHGFVFVPLWIVGGMVTYSLAFLFSVLFTSEFTALGAAYGVFLMYQLTTHLPKMHPYLLSVGDLMIGKLGNMINVQTLEWTGTVPLTLLCEFAAVALCLFVVAAGVTTRQDL
jgi:ABC-type transport system involved in multi-copper enzyme maturation permease subunit